MKGIIAVCFAMLSMTATAEHEQSNNEAALLGCWQLDEIVITKLDGEIVRQKEENRCRDSITKDKVFNTCRDRLGLVRYASERSYEMPSPDKLLLKGSRIPEEFDFVGGRLRRTISNPAATPTARVPNPEVRRENFFTRVASVPENCLPEAERVSANNAWSIWRGPDLAQWFARSKLEYEFATSLQNSQAFRIPAEGLRPADRERALKEFWKVFDQTIAQGMTSSDNQGASLAKARSEKKVCNDHRQTMFLASPDVKRWAADVVDETIALQTVTGRIPIAMSLIPEEFEKLLKEESSAESRASKDRLKLGLISDQFLLTRALVIALAERPDLSNLLNVNIDFVALRELGTKNIKFSEENNLHYTDIMRCPGQLSAILPDSNHASLEQAKRTWRDGLALLKARIDYATEPNSAGRCKALAQNLDLASLQASKGELRLIKNAAGSPLADSLQLLNVSEAFARGCYVAQDVGRARKALEQFDVVTSKSKPAGKAERAVWCRLSHWYRYGIGGAKDLQAAESWERRVKNEFSDEGCHQIPVVDPASPWRVL